MPALPPTAARTLTGAWRLVSWSGRDASGAVAYPFGQAAVGSIVYTAEGAMAAQIMRPDRAPFAGNDPFRGTAAENAAAVRGYIAYAGTFRIEGDTVIHRVEMSLFPNWIGGEQRRQIEWEGDRLVLSTPPIATGGAALLHRLVWERAPAASGNG